MRGLRGVIGTMAFAVVIGGCSVGQATGPSGSGEAEMTFHDSVVQARAEAKAQGANEAQLAILDAALASDEIAFEDARQALNDYGSCLEGTGWALVGARVTEDAGFKTLGYAVNRGSDDAAVAVVDACYAKTFKWVDMLYQTQPAATQAADAKFEAARPALIDCLQAGGIPVDDASPADEVRQAMLAVLREDAPKPGDPGVTVNPDGSILSDHQSPQMEIVSKCLNASGLYSF